MKQNLNKISLWTALSMSAALYSLTACSDDANIGSVDEEKYHTEAVSTHIVNDLGASEHTLFEYRTQGKDSLYIKSNKAAAAETQVTITVDESVLTAYNEKMEKNYQLLPASSYTISESVVMPKGSKVSTPISISVTSAEATTDGASYVIPIRATLENAASSEEITYLMFVKDMTKLADASKANGMEIIHILGQNSNPLINLQFTLKSNGKPLVDYVVFFAHNLRFNAAEGRVFIRENENIQSVMDYREKYIKPLQDRGIKVVLGLLNPAISRMVPEVSALVARDLGRMIDAYQLDGVFFDDEYSLTPDFPDVGMLPSSNRYNSSLFMYQTKQYMPDKAIMAYAYGPTAYVDDIEGHQAGEFIDYGISDYGRGSDLGSNYPGMPKARMALYSQEFAQSRFASTSNLDRQLNDGYLSHMIFVMEPGRTKNVDGQMNALKNIAKHLCNDELVIKDVDGKEIIVEEGQNAKEVYSNAKFYKKDW